MNLRRDHSNIFICLGFFFGGLFFLRRVLGLSGVGLLICAQPVPLASGRCLWNWGEPVGVYPFRSIGCVRYGRRSLDGQTKEKSSYPPQDNEQSCTMDA